jgi:Family of unknown function (DUF5372)
VDTFYNDSWTAPNLKDERRRFRISHPFHPLCGREFDLVEHKCIYAESYLFFYDPSGHLLQIPAVWTNFLKSDAFIEVAAGRSALHADYLLQLAEVLRHLRQETPGEV